MLIVGKAPGPASVLTNLPCNSAHAHHPPSQSLRALPQGTGMSRTTSRLGVIVMCPCKPYLWGQGVYGNSVNLLLNSAAHPKLL